MKPLEYHWILLPWTEHGAGKRIWPLLRITLFQSNMLFFTPPISLSSSHVQRMRRQRPWGVFCLHLHWESPSWERALSFTHSSIHHHSLTHWFNRQLLNIYSVILCTVLGNVKNKRRALQSILPSKRLVGEISHGYNFFKIRQYMVFAVR